MAASSSSSTLLSTNLFVPLPYAVSREKYSLDEMLYTDHHVDDDDLCQTRWRSVHDSTMRCSIHYLFSIHLSLSRFSSLSRASLLFSPSVVSSNGVVFCNPTCPQDAAALDSHEGRTAATGYLCACVRACVRATQHGFIVFREAFHVAFFVLRKKK